MEVSKKLAGRIKAYSAMGSAILAADATAAVVYTDITPDFNGGATSSYLLDLNNDAVNDFEIFAFSSYSSYYLFIKPLASGNAVLGSSSSSFEYPYALYNAATVSPAASGSWLSGSAQSLNYTGSFGNWIGVADRYLGLRITVGGNIYYGWCRMDVNATGNSWVVKDYAYENTANTAITAGDTGGPAIVLAGGASNISVADVGNALDGTDLQVSFDKAADESTIGEYRIMAVKSAGAGTFDVTAAQAVASSDYIGVAPSGTATYTQTYPSTGTDVDGDAITVGQPYRIFVLSIADGTNANTDSLAGPTAEITLINDIGVDEFGLETAEVYADGKTLVVDMQHIKSPLGEITVREMSGKVVLKQNLRAGTRSTLSLDNCTSGLYLVNLQIEDYTLSEKVVIR